MRPPLVLLLLLGLPLGAQVPAETGTPSLPEGPELYGGPSLPSRRGATGLNRESGLFKIRPFVSVQGIYDTGLTGVTLDSTGTPSSEAGAGVEASAGVLGFRSWKHTVVGLDYRMNARHYSNHTFYDGIDNALTLSVDHEVNRHWRVLFGQSLASYSRNYYMPYGGSWLGVQDFAPAGLADLAGHEMFDGRTTALSSTARAIYQANLRLSFSFGGSGAFVHRRSDALPGMQAYAASGDVAYRVSRYQTIGADYGFLHYGFRNAFGSMDAHGAGFNYAVRLNRAWEFRLRAGGYRVEALRLQQVPVDPVIASIIGRNYGIETYHRIRYVPAIDAGLVRAVRRTLVSLAYSRNISPGNGVLTSSVQESGGAHVSWTATRRVSLGLGGQVTKLSSIGQNLARYLDYGGGGGVNVLLGKGFSLITRLDARRYELGRANFERVSYRASFGIAWSPGDIPLSLW